MKKYTQQEILDCIKNIADLVNDGDSIQIATKKVCKNSGNRLSVKVRKHPLYMHILNDYMKKNGYHIRFYHKEGRLQPISAKKFDQMREHI